MKKIFCVFLILVLNLSCESKRESCINDLVENEGYSYEDACDTCADASIRR